MTDKKYFLILISLIVTISLFSPQNLNATIYGSIRGKIIAGDTGKPLENVQVLIYFHHTKYGVLNPKSSFTDKEGKFCFEKLEEGKYYLTYESPHPYIGNDRLFSTEYWSKNSFINWPGTIILGKGENLNINITEDQIGGSISGRILKGDGVTPFPDVGVIAGTSSPKWSYSGDRSKEDGRYMCISLVPGDNYSVSVQLLGYGDKRISGIKVEAKKNTSGIDIIINTDDPTGVEGTVTTPDGKPIKGELVGVYMKNKWGGGRNFTDENGKYSISALEQGVYTIVINMNGKRKIIEGIIIENGKKTKIDIVFDPSFIKQSNSGNSFSPQSFFLRN